MAVLAVLSLGVTVFLAQRALGDASEVVIRGEGDSLIAAVAVELTEDGAPPSAAKLERALSAHEQAGLRYLAIVDREGHPVAEAGAPEMQGVVPRPGQSRVVGKRARVSGPLMPPRRFHPTGERPPERPPGMPIGPALLVVELEPPVIQTLRADLWRIAIVGGIAGIALLAFAIAWSRSAARLAEVEAKAAREQRLVALGSMSSVMAHELRNPLASLKGHAQLLVEDLEEPRARAKAERVVREAERLEGLTTSLLDFVRDGPIERAAVAPSDLVTRATEDLAADRVTLELEDAPEQVRVDAARLARALHNLVENALQATPDGAKVTLRAERDGDAVVFEVRDRGEGIPAGAEERIFEPFHTTRTKGTGLGLAVARRIAEQHGGTLTGANHPDGGAVFRLRFPVESS